MFFGQGFSKKNLLTLLCYNVSRILAMLAKLITLKIPSYLLLIKTITIIDLSIYKYILKMIERISLFTYPIWSSVYETNWC